MYIFKPEYSLPCIKVSPENSVLVKINPELYPTLQFITWNRNSIRSINFNLIIRKPKLYHYFSVHQSLVLKSNSEFV